MTDATFSIVVPTFRRPDALRATLDGLASLDYPHDHLEVLVVDDAADPLTPRVVEPFSERGLSVKLEAQGRCGAARARNRGAKLAGGEILLFCDDDMLVEPAHLRMHLTSQRHHAHSIVSGRWEFAPAVESQLRKTAFGRYRIDLERRYQRSAAGEALQDDPDCLRMSLLGAGNLCLSRDLFWEIGGFDEEFPVAGAEDQDFSLRALASGASLLLDTRIRCYQDDNRITLRSYCEREERSAQTVPFLARKYPARFAEAPYVAENRPIALSDPPRLIAKKAIKRVLATRASLAVLHAVAAALERVHAPDGLLRRYYRALLGLHLNRGFRQTWRR